MSHVSSKLALGVPAALASILLSTSAAGAAVCTSYGYSLKATVSSVALYRGAYHHVTYDVLTGNATNEQPYDAESCGIALGGHLTSIENATQNTFITGLLIANGISDAWIGFHGYYAHSASNYYWLNSDFNVYNNFSAGLPYYTTGTQYVAIGTSGFWGQDTTDSFPGTDVGAIVEIVGALNEPSSFAVLFAALLGLGFLYRRKNPA